MATPTYSINGGSQLHGIRADWQRQQTVPNADGSQTFSNWSKHIWRASITNETEYIELQDALRANPLTSIETNDIDDRNTNATYTSVILTSVKGQHLAINMINVLIEFRIDSTV